VEIQNEIETHMMKVMRIVVSYGCHPGPLDLSVVISKKQVGEAPQNLVLYESQ
jgi:hypothetical protein